MTANNERRLRRQFANAFPGQVFWVENGGGGTFGFPDALLAMDGHLVPIELKASYGMLRPVQKIVHLRLAEHGVPSFVLISEGNKYRLIHSGTADSVWFVNMADLPRHIRDLSWQPKEEVA
jgi:hypothetical protein